MKIKDILRRRYINKYWNKINNNGFSVIASNCNGGCILHDLGMRFNSPFVNLWMKPNDYIKMLKNLDYYLKCELTFAENRMYGVPYPVGVLGDIYIYFEHYSTKEEAQEKWMRRSKRFNMDKLFIMFTDRDGCTYQNLKDFDALPYRNKVVFTHRSYPEFKSAYYLKGWELEECVGVCSNYKSRFSIKKYYDDFDFVAWFNKEIVENYERYRV